MGNQLSANFDIGKQVGTGGPGAIYSLVIIINLFLAGRLWTVYAGRKKSTGKAVSVFVFEKSSISGSMASAYDNFKTEANKEDQTKLLEILRKEVRL